MHKRLSWALAGILLAGCASPPSPPISAGRDTVLTPLSDARPAPAEEFNAAHDQVRVVALFSPT